MSEPIVLQLPDAEATDGLGRALAAVLPEHAVVTLCGDLGAGKTSLVRGVLRGLGVTGTVRSPTYTLVEPYRADGRRVFHLDLYRLADPEELELIGFRDLLEPPALLLVEWPERGAGVLPAADLSVRLIPLGSGREARLQATGAVGASVLEKLISNTR
jgi:tRNA threonylcarbamoyladenosine biosynthesis protein TsaE